MKRILSLILSFAMIAAMCVCGSLTAFATSGDYTVAGDAGLAGIAWDPTQNPMTEDSYTFDDVNYDYMIAFQDVAAGSHLFMVTDGTWGNSWGNGENNYRFALSDTCAVTIYFNHETKEIGVDAENLIAFQLESVTVVGNGDGDWLNGANWDTTDESNDMTEIEPGVWQIEYSDIFAFDNYQFKIAVNHSWAYNWSGEGVFDGQTNPSYIVENDGSTVRITIDLNNFNFDDKTGSVTVNFEVNPAATPAGGNTITTVGGTDSADVKGTYKSGATAATVYSVDVSWGSMDFTYTDESKGTWNPLTHQYENAQTAGWSCDTDANKITVTNRSNAAIDAGLSYTNADGFNLIAEFTDSENTAITKLSLPTAEAYDETLSGPRSSAAYMNITSGAISSGTKTTLGTITVTISDAE